MLISLILLIVAIKLALYFAGRFRPRQERPILRLLVKAIKPLRRIIAKLKRLVKTRRH